MTFFQLEPRLAHTTSSFPSMHRLALLLVLSLGLASCASSKRRAYCGLSIDNNAVLVPDSVQLQQRIDGVVAAQQLKSNLPGKKPRVCLVSVSEDLQIVDAITLFSATGDSSINAAPLQGLFQGGQPARADFGRRVIVPR